MSTALGVSVTASCSSAVSATSASGLSGLGPSGVPATSASGIPTTATPQTSSAVPATGASGALATATPRKSSVLFRSLRHPPDHRTCTSAISVQKASELQAPLTRGCYEVPTAGSFYPLEVYRFPDHATLTRGCNDDSPAYNDNMLDIYRAVTACGQPNFRGARIPIPSTF